MTSPKPAHHLGAQARARRALIYAGAMKLLDPSGFAEEIANYRFLPELAPLLAIILPPTELALALR